MLDSEVDDYDLVWIELCPQERCTEGVTPPPHECSLIWSLQLCSSEDLVMLE